MISLSLYGLGTDWHKRVRFLLGFSYASLLNGMCPALLAIDGWKECEREQKRNLNSTVQSLVYRVGCVADAKLN